MDTEQDKNLILFKMPPLSLLQCAEMRRQCICGVYKAFLVIDIIQEDSKMVNKVVGFHNQE